LVERLKTDLRLRPVRRLWPPSVRLALWLVLAAAVIAGATQLGLRHNLGAQFRQPLYVLELVALLSGAASAAAAAVLAAVPGRRGRAVGWLALVLALLAVAILGYEMPSGTSSRAASFGDGLPCIFYVAAYGLPCAALFTATARAAPLDGAAVGAYAGGAASLVGAAAVRVACSVDDPAHVLVWHMPAIVLWTVLSAVAGALWLPSGNAPRKPDWSRKATSAATKSAERIGAVSYTAARAMAGSRSRLRLPSCLRHDAAPTTVAIGDPSRAAHRIRRRLALALTQLLPCSAAR